jgi:hypothetical protein
MVGLFVLEIFTQNFYQIEIPLKVTTNQSGTNCSALSAEVVWPEEPMK